MRKLLSLSVVGLLALAVGACDEQPVSPEQQLRASHGSNGGVIEATAVYRAVGTEAAELNGFQRGERVGTLSVADDGSSLTVEGEASGLDSDGVYLSLFYDKRSSAQGSPSSGNAASNSAACEPGLGEDHPQFLTEAQMVIGSGGSIDLWVVDGDGDATLGPTSTLEYVSVKKIGTVSIRDARVNGGFGAEAVVACGVVTHDPGGGPSL